MHGIFSFAYRNARWLLGGLLLTFFSSFGQTFFISLFSGEIRESFQLSDGEFGAIYMAGTLASAVTLVGLGKTLDRFSISAVSLCVICALALACVGMSIVNSWLLLLVVIYALRLFGQGMMTHTSQTAIGRWYDADRGRAISLTSMGHQIGEALFPSVVLVLLGWYEWRITWRICAVALVVVALPTIVLLMRVEHQTRQRPPSGVGKQGSRLDTRSSHPGRRILGSLPWNSRACVYRDFCVFSSGQNRGIQRLVIECICSLLFGFINDYGIFYAGRRVVGRSLPGSADSTGIFATAGARLFGIKFRTNSLVNLWVYVFAGDFLWFFQCNFWNDLAGDLWHGASWGDPRRCRCRHGVCFRDWAGNNRLVYRPRHWIRISNYW